jgi:hypothetical protein
MALGWPVSEKGPAAGLADLAGGEVQVDQRGIVVGAVAGLVEALAVQRQRRRRLPNQRAAVTMSSAVTPQMSAAMAGV